MFFFTWRGAFDYADTMTKARLWDRALVFKIDQFRWIVIEIELDY